MGVRQIRMTLAVICRQGAAGPVGLSDLATDGWALTYHNLFRQGYISSHGQRKEGLEREVYESSPPYPRCTHTLIEERRRGFVEVREKTTNNKTLFEMQGKGGKKEMKVLLPPPPRPH